MCGVWCSLSCFNDKKTEWLFLTPSWEDSQLKASAVGSIEAKVRAWERKLILLSFQLPRNSVQLFDDSSPRNNGPIENYLAAVLIVKSHCDGVIILDDFLLYRVEDSRSN